MNPTERLAAALRLVHDLDSLPEEEVLAMAEASRLFQVDPDDLEEAWEEGL